MAQIYLIAGEASGDVLGARLMAAIAARRPDIGFTGIGGGQMHSHGLSSLFPIEELALMGLVEVLPRIRRLKRRLQETVADIRARRPDVVVTIDSPGFTLRVLREIRALGIPRAHYVAPQVWAWRERRVKHYPGLWDQLLCLLPFEPEFFARHGLPATFVGHPVLESGADQGNAARFLGQNGVDPRASVMTVMPGSRRGEVSRLLPVFGATLQRLPDLTPVVPLAGPVAELVRVGTRDWPRPPLLVNDLSDKYDAFAASTIALTKSGTSTLELAMAGVPMVVAYRVNPLTAAIARRLFTVQYASLINLLAGRAVVPELIQQECAPDRLAGELLTLLNDPAAVEAQRSGCQAALAMLRPAVGTPSEAAAEAVIALLDRPPR